MVARLGGDEFMVLCAGATTRRARRSPPAASAARWRSRSTSPASAATCGSSIGCRVAAPGEADPEALLRDADTAMYQAKEAGKDRVELFCDATRARILRRIELEQTLRTALENDELEVHYQPQIDLSAAGWSASRRSCAGARPRRPSSSRWPRRRG